MVLIVQIQKFNILDLEKEKISELEDSLRENIQFELERKKKNGKIFKKSINYMEYGENV